MYCVCLSHNTTADKIQKLNFVHNYSIATFNNYVYYIDKVTTDHITDSAGSQIKSRLQYTHTHSHTHMQRVTNSCKLLRNIKNDMHLVTLFIIIVALDNTYIKSNTS